MPVDVRQSRVVDVRGNILYLPENLFTCWLSRTESEVRLAGLFLSVYSTAITQPFTESILKSLKRNMCHLHADTDANFRKELLNHTQRLFDRLRGSTTALQRAGLDTKGQSQDPLPIPTPVPILSHFSRKIPASNPLMQSLDFIQWYIQFIQWELRSTASYQRRFTALRCLSIILRSGLDPDVLQCHLSKSAQGQLRWAFKLRITNHRLIRLLLDLLLDPFDDIRSAAISALEICISSLSSTEKPLTLSAVKKSLRRAETAMLRTGRADQADGVARTYSLLYSQGYVETPSGTEAKSPNSNGNKTIDRLMVQLEETINLARRDLSAAVDGRPVHGILAALR
jgi:hypothetical protein